MGGNNASQEMRTNNDHNHNIYNDCNVRFSSFNGTWIGEVMSRIYYTDNYEIGDEEYGIELLSGWRIKGEPGLFDSYESALAMLEDRWDEFCGYES